MAHSLVLNHMGIVPDLICLSKSLSGFGLPFSLVLLKPELDIWAPGEHNGTFRGNNLAFVTATKSIDFWMDKTFLEQLQQNIDLMDKRLSSMVNQFPYPCTLKGRGMLRGIHWDDEQIARQITEECFKNNLLIETAGANDEVLKLMPPLIINRAQLKQGLDIIECSINSVV